MLSHLRGFVLEAVTHLIVKKDEGICLASLAPASKWLQISYDWPTGALSSYRGAFPADLGSVQAVSRTTGLPRTV